MRVHRLLLVTCLSIGSMFGCGDGRPTLVKATGVVLLDGSAVDGAMISFQPISESKDGFKRPSASVTDADGKFTPGTYEKDDGIPVGKYKVAIQKQEVVGKLPPNYDPERPGDFTVRYKWSVPRKYADFASSGLTLEVTSNGLVPDKFELQSGGEKPQVELTGPGAQRNQP